MHYPLAAKGSHARSHVTLLLTDRTRPDDSQETSFGSSTVMAKIHLSWRRRLGIKAHIIGKQAHISTTVRHHAVGYAAIPPPTSIPLLSLFIPFTSELNAGGIAYIFQ